MKKLLLLFFLSFPAHAVFMIEPYVGQQVGKFSQSGNEDTLSGLVHGFRTGYLGKYLIAGLDFSLHAPEFNPTFLGETCECTYKNAELGAYIGVIYPRSKFYISYSSASLQKRNNNPNGRVYFGETIKLGAGFRLFWRVFLNAEYLNSTYDEYEEERDLTYKVERFKIRSWQATLSVVFTIQ